jgi:hypothetical protein
VRTPTALMTKLPPLRRSAASRLRGLADHLEPPQLPLRSTAPLIRMDGRWWQRDELIRAVQPDEAPAPASSPR